MYLTIQQATKLTGKSRATISRHIGSGKLSKTDSGIDTAELMRVYGALVSTLDDSMTTRDDSITHQNNELVDALRAQIDLLKNQVSREKEQGDHWRNQALLLTYQPAPTGESLLWKKLFGKR